MLKIRAGKFVDIGRNCAVDETSIACRSKYARHLIVYNATKPTGKYHFKVYMCCCAESWLMTGFRLHCTSDIQARLGEVDDHGARASAAATSHSSEVRKHVIEVTRQLHHTKRIVNTDNLYTSCQLLEALRVFGLYGRGTTRENSKHFPKHVMLSKKDKATRGTMRQAVNRQNKIVAASWVDGAVVNIVSSADPSSNTVVKRTIGQRKVDFTAPMCVIEYNHSMQGVDRLDQLRARFSIADGHTFQKWHKKLAMAFIDLAKCNAFITRKLSGVGTDARDPHRDFVVQLISELLNGSWRNSLTELGLLHEDPVVPDASILSTPLRERPQAEVSQPNAAHKTTCTFVWSRQHFIDSKPKRECVICRFEGRYATEYTTYCLEHKVALCSKTYPMDWSKGYVCQQPELTCWQKFHDFHLPAGLYNVHGRIRRSSQLYKASKAEVEGLELFPPSAQSTVSSDYCV